MRLLIYLPSHIALAVEWSVATGTREDETFSLDWSTVYLDLGHATVRAEGSRQHTVWLSERRPWMCWRVPRARAEARCLMAATGGSCLSGAWNMAGIEDFRLARPTAHARDLVASGRGTLGNRPA